MYPDMRHDVPECHVVPSSLCLLQSWRRRIFFYVHSLNINQPLPCSAARVYTAHPPRGLLRLSVHPPAKCDRPLTQYHLQPLRFAPHPPRVSTRPPIIRTCVTAKINDVNGKALPLSATALTDLRDASNVRLSSRLFRLAVGLFWRNAGRRHGDQNEGSVTRH
jgi:hypothetical protein